MQGVTERKYIHQSIERHENLLCHKSSSEAYFLRRNNSNVENLLFSAQIKVRREQVRKRRDVMERIVDVIKVIGKRGLSYRGHEMEAAYTLENEGADHGNFLELVLLLGKYDICMKEHLNECIEKSKIHHESGKTGRGSLITMLSKNTVNHIIDSIRHLIKKEIVNEVCEAGIFSIQIDTTQDVTCKEQCSVIIRYVTNERIVERLFGMLECHSTTGKALEALLVEHLTNYQIDIKNV